MHEYFPLIDQLIEYLQKHKFEVEDKELQFFLHHCEVKLSDVKALLQLLEQLVTFVKIATKL